MSGKDEVLSLDDDQVPSTINLVSKDGKVMAVDKKYASISKLIAIALESDQSATDVPVDVSADVLTLIVNYMNAHRGTEAPIIEKPLKSKIMKEVTNSADAAFIDSLTDDKQRLYDLILAANYLDIKGLLHLGCAKVASMIKGQPLEKIKEILSADTRKSASSVSSK